ncbi:MAG: phosphoribosylformylglycinamidine synthase subunit PurL [Anaerolineae bacterium]
MEAILRIEVIARAGETPADLLLEDISALGIQGVERVERSTLYFVAGDIDRSEVERLCRELLVDPIVQTVTWGAADAPLAPVPGAARIEVGLLPGVTDTVADNVLARARLLGLTGIHAVSTGESYRVYGNISEHVVRTIAEKLLCNGVIQYYEIGQLAPHVGAPTLHGSPGARTVPIRELNDSQLETLSREGLLALDLAEMQVIQRYFGDEGRDPTDVELESLAQTWSEHCVHKTFKAIVQYRETTDQGTTVEEIDSLIRTYLQAATNAIDAPFVRSAFVDNAGIIAFGEHELSFKAETHNHPSALEPFGGANTGVGGVVRDIMGVSARPIANTNVLCFGPLDTDPETLAAGVLHPRRIYSGVVAGVQDYGNKMGIPTVNGAIYFHPGYTGNPLVYCGCAGIAPAGAHPNGARTGDLVVVLGGRTGRDGLHGATFSSIELTDETGELSGGAVQIGNPVIEKMMLDALLVARDEGLYTAITDCGAGGLSSAVSEMGEDTGVVAYLDRVPLKYQGLAPWEIWVSEAQERMVIAVPPQNEARLREICDAHSVEMTVIGTFTDDARLHLQYGDAVVADLSMAFLHKGLPRRRLQAEWSAPTLADQPQTDNLAGDALAQCLLSMLADPNVRSKEDVVRRYDHEVLGGTIVKPILGARNHGPGDAAVMRPMEVGEGWQGFALGAAFNPAYGAVDPYAMAVSAIDEAVRNVVCVGADPERTAILDNFCWGNPRYPDRLGSLVRALKGCYDGALAYRTPFVSGKDSLNNEYLDTNTGQQTSIPPSLLISSIGLLDDVRQSCTSDLKPVGGVLYMLGVTRAELGGSLYSALGHAEGYPAPTHAQAGPATARMLHKAIKAGLVAACHDCSEGGLAVAAAEMALAGDLGAELWLEPLPRDGADVLPADVALFSESNGRYLVQVREQDVAAFEALVAKVPHAQIGRVSDRPALSVTSGPEGSPQFVVSLQAIEYAWRGHVAPVPGEEHAR